MKLDAQGPGRAIRPLALLLVTMMLSLATSGPAPAQVEATQEARDLFTEALEHHRAKRLDEALDTFMRAYSADSSILSYSDEGLLAAALASLREKHAANPDDLTLTFRLAELSNLSGYSEESLALYKKVLALAPSSPQAVIAQEEARKIEAALEAVRQADAEAERTRAQAATAAPLPEDGADAGPSDPGEAEESRFEKLRKDLEEEREKSEELEEKLSELQKEYDKLKKDADKWYFYYTRFFADPRNIEKLGAGQ